MSLIRFAQRHPWLLAGAGLLVGIFSGPSIDFLSSSSVNGEIREFNSAYQYISPLIACQEGDEALANDVIQETEEKVASLIAGLKTQGRLTEAAVYFRELDGGGWFGIAQETLFTPGSLLKVPLVMSAYKYTEVQPDFALAAVTLNTDQPTSTYEPHFKPRQSIEQGGTYTIDDLVRATLVFSDNNAALLLGGLLPLQQIINSYTHLGVESPEVGSDAKMTVRTYASFFRILYNASYLSREYSEKVLALLAESDFRKGLVAGVPAKVIVAHKFGERERTSVEELQLHDCGIVYHDPKPYVLCVMTRGDDFDQLAESIKQISALVYAEVDS